MKTKAFCSILILIGVFVFSSCSDYIPEGPVTIEIVDGNCLILKKAPFDTVANVIFLERLSFENSTNYSWKRKSDGGYKTVSINWINYHSLSPNYAYVIMDTVKIPSLYTELMRFRNQGDANVYSKQEKFCHEQLIDAYFHPEKTRKIGKKPSYHFNSLGTMITKTDSGLTVKYNPINKDFKEVSPIVEEKTSFSFWFLITLIIFIIAAFNLAKIYDEDYSELEIRMVSWVLLIGAGVGISYLINLNDINGSTFLNIIIGFIGGGVACVLYRISLCFKKEKTQKIIAMILLPIISSFLIWKITEQLTVVLIYLAIVAVIYLFYILGFDYYTRKLLKKLKKK